MRQMFLVMLLGVTMAGAIAQQATTLSLAKTPTAVKITDPQRQMVVFAPLFSRIDDIWSTLQIKGVPPSVIARNKVADIAAAPGVNSTGDFWLVMFPPQKTINLGDETAATKSGVKTENIGSFALVVPLTDANAFAAYLKNADAKKLFPRAKILGESALLTLYGPDLPTYTAIDTRVTLASDRDVVIHGDYSAMDFATLEAQAGPMGGMLGSMTSMLSEIQANVRYYDVGLTMHDDFYGDYYLTPVMGSALAKVTKAAQVSPLALNLAGFLPENLAYCGASGSMLPGIPGSANTLARIGVGVGGAFFLPAERHEALVTALDALSAQCSQGRALGVTTPGSALGTVTLTAAYHVEDPALAYDAVKNFIVEVSKSKKEAMGGMLADALTLTFKRNYGMLSGVSVDLLKISASTPSADGKSSTPVFTIECYFAYPKDTMLFTASLSSDSKTQMAAMIDRVQLATPGYTCGKRFQAISSFLPTDMRSFEHYEILDLCRTGVNLFPMPDASKKDALKMLNIFPAQSAGICSYTDLRDGLVHGEVRLPAGQMDVLTSLVKVVISEMQSKKPPAKK